MSDVWQSLFRRPGVAGLIGAARAAAAAGNRRLAIDCAERALARDVDCHDARLLLGELYLPGRSYDRVLADIHRHLRPRSYVEIGVATGKSLVLAGPQTAALGVDPAPALQVPLPPNARLIRKTSDEFFAAHDVRAELGGLDVELAFIDGLHLFDSALRDFINLERLCSRGATILVHDCFPLDRGSAQRERKTGFWSGDVWRLVVLLKKHRPDLRIRTIAAPPTGLAMIRGLDPSSSVLADRREALVEEYLRLDYRYLMDDREAKLNLVADDWDAIRRLLDEPAA